ncbi:hypothetical protein ACP70R_020031 [Stipagrostis hirtigluma subsp. patula]
MNTVCEVCGDIGFKQLLLCCSDCKGAARHQYCLDEVLYDASLVDWMCDECQQRSSEVACSRYPGKVSSERLTGHSSSTLEQPITKKVDPARVEVPRGGKKSKSYMARSASLKKHCPSRMTSFRKRRIRKKSNLRPVGNGLNRRGYNATTSIACTSERTLHSCETIVTETAKSSNCESQQVVTENSVPTLNNQSPPRLQQTNYQKPLDGSNCEQPLDISRQLNLSNGQPSSFSSLKDVERPTPVIVNCLGYTLGGTDQSHPMKIVEGLAHISKKARQKLGSGSKNLESSNPTTNQVNSVLEISGDKSKCLKDRKLASVLDDSEESEPSKLNVTSEVNSQAGNKSSDELLMSHKVEGRRATIASSQNISTSNVHVTQNHPEQVKENSGLASVHIEIENPKEKQNEPLKLSDQVCSSLSVEIPSKAKSVLEASAAEVRVSDVQNFGNDNPRKRRRLILPCDDEEEEEVQHSLPVKRRRKYLDANEGEDEEDIVGAASAECALNGAANCSLHDGPNLASETVVAEDHPLQSRTAHDPESSDQQYYIYSQPVDEPVWTGVFKIDSEVFVKLDAHLSTKACQRVWELSTSLQPVVEVTKLPRLQTWPKRWMSAGPTDDSIGLFFLPHNSGTNEVSDRLVDRIIKCDGSLKVTVGIAELLIFPSSLLPEQYHLFQGKHYLWGVFKRREDIPDKERDISADATEEGELQEQDLLDQQAEACESSDQETVVKHVVHVEDQLLVQSDREAQEAMKVAPRVDMTSSCCSWSSAKPDSPNAGSNCSLQPRIEDNLLVPEAVDQQVDTSSPEWNASSVTKESSNSGPAKLVKPAGHGQPCSDSEPPTTKLFGFVAARTPRSQQLIQEMASEGALLFSVPEAVVATDSSAGDIITEVGAGMKPDTEYPHLRERPQSFDFVSFGSDEHDVASESCLELFPVRQEQIGWAPRVEVSKEVDLDLSLGTNQRPPSLPPL